MEQKLRNGKHQKLSSSAILKFRNSEPAFTLIELLVSVALLIVAISIALFATIGVNGLVQRSDARGTISEAGRTVGDELRRRVNDAPVGGVSLLEKYDNTATTPYAGIQVKSFSSAESFNTCTVIGRAVVNNSSADDEEIYSLSVTGSLVAAMIYRVDDAGRCPSSSPIYQNRLTSSQSTVKDMRFSLQTVDCSPVVTGCISKQLLRYSLTVELAQKVVGAASEAKKPTLTLQGALPIGLVNEAATLLAIDTTSLPNAVANCDYSKQLVASGGSGAGYSWSYGPSPPSWLLLGAETGILSATQPLQGTRPFTVRVADNANHTADRNLSLTVDPVGACQVDPGEPN